MRREHGREDNGDLGMRSIAHLTRAELIELYLPRPAPVAWVCLDAHERERRGLYAAVALLSGKTPARAWHLAMATDAAAELALDDADEAVSVEVLLRMIHTAATRVSH